MNVCISICMSIFANAHGSNDLTPPNSVRGCQKRLSSILRLLPFRLDLSNPAEYSVAESLVLSSALTVPLVP